MDTFVSPSFLVLEATGQPYQLLLPIAIILFLAKSFAILCKRVKFPQVIGFLASGIILGLITFIPGQDILTDYTKEGLDFFAKIGVILIMFSAGVETNTKQIKSSGKSSMLITLGGVIFPMAFGTLVATLFLGTEDMLANIFYGTVLTATSVSITVATLKEMGKLDSKVGTSIISAAILDDIIGVILLSLIISLSGKSTGADANVLMVIAKMVLYFIIGGGLGFLVKRLFVWLDEKYPHHRRIPIFGLVVCFVYAYAAERWFGVADITGAYIAGLILSLTKKSTSSYIDRRTEISSYIIFGPVFFANIGLMMYDGIEFNDMNFIFFGIAFVVAGLLGKILGAGLCAKACRFTWRDSLKVGIGMMARAEVVIVCAQKGITAEIINPAIMPFILLLIVVTSFATPVTLKALYKNEEVDVASAPLTSEANAK